MVHGKRQWGNDRHNLGGGIRISLRPGDDHEHAQRGSGARRGDRLAIAARLQALPLDDWWSLPVVAETWDGYLNDINGFHVKAEDADAAMRDAHSGPIAEGNVGGGTGMICFEFKGGTGTASRQLPEKLGGYTVGVLVQCNFGTRHLLRIAGAPVGYEITGHPVWGDDTGSIIVVVATDAPLLPSSNEAHREARDVWGWGAWAAFRATARAISLSRFPRRIRARDWSRKRPVAVQMLPNDRMDALFEATVQATEEAVVNALVAAKTMTGADGHTVEALPHDRLREVLKKYNRLAETK